MNEFHFKKVVKQHFVLDKIKFRMFTPPQNTNSNVTEQHKGQRTTKFHKMMSRCIKQIENKTRKTRALP